MLAGNWFFDGPSSNLGPIKVRHTSVPWESTPRFRRSFRPGGTLLIERGRNRFITKKAGGNSHPVRGSLEGEAGRSGKNLTGEDG